METTFQNYYSYSTGIERFGASIPFYYNPKVQDQYNFKAASITKEEWEDAGNTGFPYSPFAMTYNHQGKKILLMRIPSYNVTSKEATRNVKTYEMLLKKYQDQVDVLVLDQTHNPGGSVSYVQDLAELFLKSPGPGIAFAPRADREWLRRWNSFLSEPDLSIFEKNFIQQIYREIDEANDAGDFLAPPIPLTSISGTIPGKYVWQKPVLLLIDELCGSGGDAFPMIMKGNQAATLWGHRTSGLGGNVDAISPLPITKADLKLTRSLFFLANANDTIPDGPLIENNGVEPDVNRDYGYQDLMEGYTSYIQDFSDYAVGLASPAS
ncbi:S41 family peptidase [Pseudobacteriovorax antillogorgiicola]|uniref:Peptidase family S41 n=1 Tax=Pseudobacteriovorax antillogorgiicola TaxID=1513793 RepID=A0A1Y6CH91_9BACT|nr:S41 family peptidase [Pseudobacteriovorax antillogorgiicola]TCS49007.1 peptidase S41-like protein [Pseudobacteriovorax antillogorgiicola]SMF53180.1 Peptidase family S41 [Pseudobacteriovorax antillogorgiicola]